MRKANNIYTIIMLGLTLAACQNNSQQASDEKMSNENLYFFDLFYQADNSRSGEGFGIGLALSKQIVDSLGAEIKVLDNNPSGSKFIISFLTEN